jgi:hypothetical protein
MLLGIYLRPTATCRYLDMYLGKINDHRCRACSDTGRAEIMPRWAERSRPLVPLVTQPASACPNLPLRQIINCRLSIINITEHPYISELAQNRMEFE